jgi:hypothetical protein
MSKNEPQESQPATPEVEQEVETIHVPRGKSRARYLFTIGLLIFILIIFVVSDLFQSVVSRQRTSSDEPFMEWNHPRLGLRSIGYRDFVLERKQFEDFYAVLGVDRRQSRDLTDDESIARTLILDELAIEAGIEYTDDELRSMIRERFGDAATFKQILAARQVAAPDFQETLRRMLRVQRYESMLADLVAQPDPAEIERVWREQHKEHALEFASFRADASEPQVLAELPDAAGLSTWYDALDVNRKRQLFGAQFKPERVSLELAYFPFEGADGAALNARFPRPEGTDLAALAREFHTNFAHLRFRRPEEKVDAADARERLYFTFDEVAERAQAEALAHAAFMDWARDVRARQDAGALADLAGEATALGLRYIRETSPKTQMEWSSFPDVGGAVLADAAMRASRGDRFISGAVTEKVLLVGRVLERLESGPPPFAEVAEAAATEWKNERAQKMARDRAGQLVEACKPPLENGVQPQPIAGSSEEFAQKAAEQGVAVVSTDWFDQATLPNDAGPSDDDLRHFLRELKGSARTALSTIPNAVMGPYVSTDKSRVFVARYIGVREAPEVKLAPRDFRSLQATAQRQRQEQFSKELLGQAGLERNFGLRFPGRTGEDPNAPPPELSDEPQGPQPVQQG